MQSGEEYPTFKVGEGDVSPSALALVRVEFNPSKMGIVDEVKILSARLITIMQDPSLDKRHSAIAIHEYEAAAMWAVKALTGKK